MNITRKPIQINPNHLNRLSLGLLFIFSLLLVGCSGGGDDKSTESYTISGTISGDVTSGVTVTLSGANSSTTTTNASGSYSFTDLANGTYTVTPTLAGYTFSPTNRAVTLSSTDSTGSDFVSTSTNAAPVANIDDINVDEGGTATALDGGAASVLANDSDAEADPLTAVLDSDVSSGTLTLDPVGTFSYTHDGSETTVDSFTYHANDGTVDSNTVTVSITINPQNDPPVAVAESASVTTGGTVTVFTSGATSVLANDTDAESDPLTAVMVTDVSNGALTLNSDGTFSYTHDGGVTASDSFSYHANDGTANSNTVTVPISITSNVDILGTWGFGRLKHHNNGTWAAKSGKFTYNADGTGSSAWQENDNNILNSGTSTWIWTVITNPDGSITLIRTFPDTSIKTQRIVISDDGMVMIMDGTDNLNNQRFRVAIRMDTIKTYTNADLNGDYYDIQYNVIWNGLQYQHSTFSSEWTSDGDGNIFGVNSAGNTNGTIGGASCAPSPPPPEPPIPCSTYIVNPDGSWSINGGPAENRLSGDGGVWIGASSSTTDSWNTIFGMKKADQAYTNAHLEGTWAYISFEDIDTFDGRSFASAFGIMVCNNTGNCTANAKFQRDGMVTIESDNPPALSVLADGSFGASLGPGTPTYAGAIGNSGNVIIANLSFVDLAIRRTIVGVRCSACVGLGNEGAWLTQLTNNLSVDQDPNWSPDGTKIVFTSNRSGYVNIWIMDANGGNPTQLTNNIEDERHPHFSSNGLKIVFISEGIADRELWTMNIDGTDRVNISNNPAKDGVGSWSPNDSQIVFMSDRSGNNDIWIMAANGSNPTQLTNDIAVDSNPQFSPDGTQIVFSSKLSGENDLWTMDVDGSNLIQLTTNPANDNQPSFSNDGTRIVFLSSRSGNKDIWMMNSDGTEQTQITTNPAPDNKPDFNQDGTKIVFHSYRSANYEIWTYTLPYVVR